MAEFISHYRVGSKLGQGAMGEVYRATDTKLGRDVAIKLISPSFAADETRLASFAREAQVLASLNHPNIAAIYGVEDHALVMELVEGPTLADRIKQGPMRLDEALPIARQIAEGLAAAHDRGIVHRDLKPANIKITPGGVVKLLDFGLAKAAAVAAVAQDDAATVAFSMVGADQIVGTPAYMAPEQARGLPLDRRADIWAFGVVFYEMLTGTALFKGETLTDIMAAVVREEPDLTKVPAAVRPVLRRCLEKDPKRRLRDVGDAALLLENAGEAPFVETRASAARAWLPWAAAALAAVAFAVLLAVHLRETPPVAQTVRFTLTLPPEVTVTQATPFAVSPSGRAVVFPAVGADGVSRIWVQDFDKTEPRSTGTPISAAPEVLVWLDDRAVLFSQDRKLKRVDIGGGPPTTLADYEPPVIGVAVSRDGTILYGSVAGIMRVDPSGGTATRITTAAGDMVRHAANDFLPDGRHFLYSDNGEPGKRRVYVGSLDAQPDDQPATPILTTDFGVAYVADPRSSKRGYLLTVNDSTIVAQPFDLARRTLVGEPRPVAENVFVVNNSPLGFGIASYSASQDGALVYRTGTLAERLSRQLAWLSRDGKPLGTLAELGRFNHVKLSPDGKRVATSRTELETGNFADIWVTDLDAETSTKFTFGGGANVQPVWSPDGRYVAWARARQKDIVLYRKSADGAGAEEELVTLPERRNLIMSDWTSDGAFVIYTYDGDIFALPVAGQGSRKPIPIAATMANEFGGSVSPDRRWVAYISNETSRQEVYVQPFAPGAPTPAGRWLVSNAGSIGMIRWRADSRELVFLNTEGELRSVDVTSTPVFKASSPRTLFQMPRPFLVQAGTPGALADATRDLDRILVAMPSETGRQQQLSVLLHWPTAMSRSRR